MVGRILSIVPGFRGTAKVIGGNTFTITFTLLSVLVCVTTLLYSRADTFEMRTGVHGRVVRGVIALSLNRVRGVKDNGLHGAMGSYSDTARACLTRRLPSVIKSVIAPVKLLVFLLTFS